MDKSEQDPPDPRSQHPHCPKYQPPHGARHCLTRTSEDLHPQGCQNIENMQPLKIRTYEHIENGELCKHEHVKILKMRTSENEKKTDIGKEFEYRK